VTQIRPDELIRILRGELEAIGAGGGAALLGYDENGAFALGQTVTGADSVGIGNDIIVGGNNSIVAGGLDNEITARHQNAILGGSDNTISSTAGSEDTICGGWRNTINCTASSGSHLVAGGSYNEISGAGTFHSASIIGGGENKIVHPATFAIVLGGLYGKADKYSQVVNSSGRFAAVGDAQGTIQMVVRIPRASHTLNQWYELFPAGGVGGPDVTIPASTAWSVYCLVVGITQFSTQQWGYEITGLIEHGGGGVVTVRQQTTLNLFESDANYNAQIAADNVNKALEVQVRRTGGVDYDIRWVATIRTVEVTYP